MGQVLGFCTFESTLAVVFRSLNPFPAFENYKKNENQKKSFGSFVDLRLLPPELSLNILSKLNATDLCLASCVWYNLSCNESLWQSLCKATWPFCSAYTNGVLDRGMTYRQLYLKLDEACLTFNANAFEGMDYMFKQKLLDDNSEDLIQFFVVSKNLKPLQKRIYLESRPDLLEAVINFKSFYNQSLPDALRQMFEEFPAPLNGLEAFSFINKLITIFSTRFAFCNTFLGLTKDDIYILCFSIIMLSTDFWSPHIKNKMSKREFIRNTRQVVDRATIELLGHIYDNVYVVGHVVLNQYRGSPIQPLNAREIVMNS